MTIFYLDSSVISGHEYVFKKIFEQYQYPKKLVNKINFYNIGLFYKKNILISAGSPRQNLFITFLISFLANRVFVYTPFGFDLHYFSNKFPKLKNLLYKCLLSKNNILFVTCSKEQKNYFQIRFPQKEILLVRNFNINNSLATRDSNNNKISIYYVGRIDDVQKNVSFFIKLKKLIKNDIILIGNCNSLSLYNKLTLNGIIVNKPSSNPYSYISTNDLIILPSKYEGAALVVIEATNLGIPIFLMNSVGNKFITDNPILFNNHNELVNLISLFEQKDFSLHDRIKKFQSQIIREYSVDNFLIDHDVLSKKIRLKS